MPVVIITPAIAFRLAREQCVEVSRQIRRLESTPLGAGETIDDRMRRIAALALPLAEAFALMDHMVEEHNVSPLQTSEGSPVHRGVPGEDPTTN